MLKHLTRIVALSLVLILGAGASMAQQQQKNPTLTAKELKKIDKENAKKAKKICKDKKKQKWLFEQTGTPEDIITRHLTRMTTEGLEEKVATATGRKSRSLARKQIGVDVANEYAQEQSLVMKGEILGQDGEFTDADAEGYRRQFQGKYASDIRGEIVESYSLYRKNGDGTYDMEVYFLIDPAKAQASKLRAMRYALERAEMSDKLAQRIRDNIAESEKNFQEEK